MTFQDLATTLGARSQNLRESFSRNRWSIHRPADVQQFLLRFVARKTRAKRPYQTAAHLKKWWFVAQARPAAAAAEIKKIQILERKLAAALRQAQDNKTLRQAQDNTRKKMAVERRTKAEKMVAQEKISSLQSKLAAAERKIAAKVRAAEKSKSQKLKVGDSKKVLPKVEPVEKSEKIKIENSAENKSEPKTENFGFVPSAAERRAAARARLPAGRQDRSAKNEPIKKKLVAKSEKVSVGKSQKSETAKNPKIEKVVKNKVEPKNKTVEISAKTESIKSSEKPKSEIALRAKIQKDADWKNLRTEVRERIAKLGSWDGESETQNEAAVFEKVSAEESKNEKVENLAEAEKAEIVEAEPKIKKSSEVEVAEKVELKNAVEKSPLPPLFRKRGTDALNPLSVKGVASRSERGDFLPKPESEPEVEPEVFEQVPTEKAEAENSEKVETPNSEPETQNPQTETAEIFTPIENEAAEISETLETETAESSEKVLSETEPIENLEKVESEKTEITETEPKIEAVEKVESEPEIELVENSIEPEVLSENETADQSAKEAETNS